MPIAKPRMTDGGRICCSVINQRLCMQSYNPGPIKIIRKSIHNARSSRASPSGLPVNVRTQNSLYSRKRGWPTTAVGSAREQTTCETYRLLQHYFAASQTLSERYRFCKKVQISKLDIFLAKKSSVT